MQQSASSDIAIPSLGVALIPIILTIGLLGIQIFYYDDFTPHIALAIGFGITALVGCLLLSVFFMLKLAGSLKRPSLWT